MAVDVKIRPGFKMTCLYCGRVVEGHEEHGAGICSRKTPEQVLNEQDKLNDLPFCVHVKPWNGNFVVEIAGQGEQRQIYLTEKQLETVTEVLAYQLGWKAGPDLQLNPNNIPTHAQLQTAVEKTLETHVLRNYEGMHRFLVDLTIIRAYLGWLPTHHSMAAGRGLDYIEGRIEELLIYRKFFRDIRGDMASAKSLSETMGVLQHRMREVVQHVCQTCGIDLWNQYGGYDGTR